MCGRPRKWFTEEDRIKAINASARKWHLKTRIANDDGNGKYKEKHKFYRYPGIKITLETFDRFYISTICISYTIGLKWSDNFNKFDVFETVCDNYMLEWLNGGQKDWSPKQHIFVWDRPVDHSFKYKGKKNYVKGQHHLKRITEPVSWYDTRAELEGLIKKMVEVITKACVETGLELYVKEIT